MAGKKGVPQRSRLTMGTCTVDGCERTGFALGLCHSHYMVSQQAEKRAMEAALKEGEIRLPVTIGKNGRVAGGPGNGREGNGRGQPPKLVPDEPTIKRIRELSALQCTLEEVAGVLLVDDTTLRDFMRKYPEAEAAFEQGKFNGRVSLRRMQFVQAKRSAAMGIWLGKQYLKQSESLRLGPLSGNQQADDLGLEPPTALLRAVRSKD
jgi:hypothetical protein